MGEHTVSSFDKDLQQIDRLIHEMSDLAGSMVSAAINALIEGDAAAAQQVISDDVVMDTKQRDVDDRAITLIAKRQPMAQDLRAVVGAIRMAGDLERVGDLAKNVAKRVGAIGEIGTPRDLSNGLNEMATLVLHQIRGVVDAYTERRPQDLQKLRLDDEKIDLKYTSVFRELLTYMMENPRNITPCTHLLFCAKNLERIGDHMTNIAENAYYVLTGTQLPLQRPKLDEMSSSIGE